MQTKIFPATLALLVAASACAEEQDDATVVVTATRFEYLRQNLPTGAIIIDSRQLADSAVTDVPEALEKLGGIGVRNSSGDPSPQLDLRGFGINGDQNTLVLLNGERISENELASARLSAIPLSAVDRIEILPGAGAVLYGSGATGGTINIITKTARPGQHDAYLGASLGSYDARMLRGGLNIAGERIGLSLHANDTDTDNYRRNNHLSEQNAEGDLRLMLENGDVHAKFGAGRQRLGLPGELSEAEIERDRRSTHRPDDHSAVDTWHASVGGRWDFGGPEVAADIAQRNRKSNSTVYFFGAPSTTAINADIQSVSPRLRLPYRVWGRDAELVLGADWSDWDYRRSISGSFTSLLESTQQDTAAYFLNTLRPADGTRIALGARWQRSKIEQNDLTFTPATKQSQTRALNAFDLSVRQTLTAPLSVYGRWAQSFRTANVDDNGFTADGKLLEPQTSHDAELGFEVKHAPARARVAVFESRVNNEIHYLPSTVYPPFGININLPPTRHRGVELDATWKVLPTLSLAATYRYTRALFRSGSFGGADVSGKEVPLVPRQRATLNASWQATDMLLMTANLRYVGSQRYDNDQTNTFRKMPSYTVVDLKLTQRLGDWKLSAQVDNLFNEKYYSYAIRNAAGTSFNAYPEAERRFLIGAEYAFR